MIESSENRIAVLESPRPLARDSITYHVMTDLNVIEGMSEEWDALLSRTFINQAFSSSKWFIAACRYDDSASPHVICARRGTSLAGVLPLVVTTEGESATFQNYLCDYNDIVAPEDDAPVIEGMLLYALSNPNGYGKVILSHVRRDSNCYRAVRAIESGRDVDELYTETNACHYADLSASYSDYLMAKTSHFRKRLKRIREIARKNSLVVRELEPESAYTDGLPEAFLRLHLNRQGARSCFASARGRAFVEEILPVLFRERRMRAIALTQGERMIGIDLYAMGADSMCAWNGGFLAEAEACSPGKLLIDGAIKLAYDLKLGEFDLLRGAEDYKKNWVTNSRTIGRMELPVI